MSGTIITSAQSGTSQRTAEFHKCWSGIRLLCYDFFFFIFRTFAALRCLHGSSKMADRQIDGLVSLRAFIPATYKVSPGKRAKH